MSGMGIAAPALVPDWKENGLDRGVRQKRYSLAAGLKVKVNGPAPIFATLNNGGHAGHQLIVNMADQTPVLHALVADDEWVARIKFDFDAPVRSVRAALAATFPGFGPARFLANVFAWNAGGPVDNGHAHVLQAITVWDSLPGAVVPVADEVEFIAPSAEIIRIEFALEKVTNGRDLSGLVLGKMQVKL